MPSLSNFEEPISKRLGCRDSPGRIVPADSIQALLQVSQSFFPTDADVQSPGVRQTAWRLVCVGQVPLVSGSGDAGVHESVCRTDSLEVLPWGVFHHPWMSCSDDCLCSLTENLYREHRIFLG